MDASACDPKLYAHVAAFPFEETFPSSATPMESDPKLEKMTAPEEPDLTEDSHRPSLVKVILRSAGTAFVSLALGGLFVPLLPTIPFLLLAAWCYSRSSSDLYRRLLEHRVLGPILRDWNESRSVSPKAKWTGVVLVLLSFAVSIVWLVDTTVLRIVLGAVGLLLMGFLVSLPTRRNGQGFPY